MINKLIYSLFGKEVIVYNKHRQTLPLLENKWNREHFYFIDIGVLIKLIPFRSNNKNKFGIILFILKIIGPKFIIDINWISRINLTYYLYCRHNPFCKFIVIQHGIYYGGVISDKAHRYTKCDLFYCWSPYFKSLFQKYNWNKKVNLVVFGNPCYNQFTDRVEKEVKKDVVLIAPSLVDSNYIKFYTKLAEKLTNMGFEVYFKEHNYQKYYSKSFSTNNKIDGSIYKILQENKFEIVISDQSTALLDAIVYGQNVLHYNPLPKNDTSEEIIYTKYISDLTHKIDTIQSADQLLLLINKKAETQLMEKLMSTGNDNQIVWN